MYTLFWAFALVEYVGLSLTDQIEDFFGDDK